MDRRRLFIAIDIPDEVRSAIADHVSRLKNIRADGLRWERSEKIHLTLKFLGDTESVKIDGLQSMLAEAAAKHDRFDITVKGTGVFPTPRKARVMWIGLRDDGGDLQQLNREIELALEPLGFAMEDREFRPHLTIARVRDPRQAERVIDDHVAADFGPLEMDVRWVTLYESKLLQTGSVYSPIRDFPLLLKN